MMNRNRNPSRSRVGQGLSILAFLGILVLPTTSLAADGLAIKWSVQDDTNMGKPDTPDTRPSFLTVPVATRIESAEQLDYLSIPFLTLTGQILMFTVDATNFSTFLEPHLEIR